MSAESTLPGPISSSWPTRSVNAAGLMRSASGTGDGSIDWRLRFLDGDPGAIDAPSPLTEIAVDEGNGAGVAVLDWRLNGADSWRGLELNGGVETARFLEGAGNDGDEEEDGAPEPPPRVKQNSTCIARFSVRKCREQIGHALDAIELPAFVQNGANTEMKSDRSFQPMIRLNNYI